MTRIVLLLLSTCLVSPLALAQGTAVAPPAAAASPTLPDIEFSADVQMQSIRFNGPPKASVTFTGGPLESRHEVGRDGLPVPVPVGRTYRNVTIRTTLSATLLDPALDAAVQAEVGAPAPASPPTATPEDAP